MIAKMDYGGNFIWQEYYTLLVATKAASLDANEGILYFGTHYNSSSSSNAADVIGLDTDTGELLT